MTAHKPNVWPTARAKQEAASPLCLPSPCAELTSSLVIRLTLGYRWLRLPLIATPDRHGAAACRSCIFTASRRT
jgi:hypothetical protein